MSADPARGVSTVTEHRLSHDIDVWAASASADAAHTFGTSESRYRRLRLGVREYARVDAPRLWRALSARREADHRASQHPAGALPAPRASR
jgi:hypothetical protein